MRGKAAPERFWFVEVPFEPDVARHAVERAIREASGSLGAVARRRRRLVMRIWFALLVSATIAMVAGMVLFFLGHPGVLFAGMALFMTLISLDRARTIVAALRAGLRPTRWSYAALVLDVLVVAGLVWSWFAWSTSG